MAMSGVAAPSMEGRMLFQQWASIILGLQDRACLLRALGWTDRRPRQGIRILIPSTTILPVREHPSSSKRGNDRKPQGGKPPQSQNQKHHDRPKQPGGQEDQKEEKGEPKDEQEGSNKNLAEPDILKLGGTPFAPLQRTLEDIPVIQFNIKKKGLHGRFLELDQRRYIRCQKVAYGLYSGKPITPFPNPSNPPCRFGNEPLCRFGHSHYAIELVDTHKGQGKRVQLLIRDFDLYLVAFRRFKKGKWSKWYFFSDLHIPEFLKGDSVRCCVNGSHDEIYYIGGHESFEFIFTSFWGYPDTVALSNKFKVPLMTAVFIFCEAFRDRWMNQEVLQRIEYDASPGPFGYYMLDTKTGKLKYIDANKIWSRVHSWGKFSRLAIQSGLYGDAFDAEGKMKDFDSKYMLNDFDEMAGLLRVLLRDDKYMTIGPEEWGRPGAGLDSPNPNFDNIEGQPLKVYKFHCRRPVP